MNPDKLIRFGFNPLSYWETLYRKRVLVGRFILFAFLLLLGRHLFQPYLFRSDDLEFHGARVANYYLALKQGQFPPRWAPNLNYGFGYPTFNFAYPLPYAIAAFFYAAGLGVEASLNVVLLLALITAGLGAMTLVWSITRNWF